MADSTPDADNDPPRGPSGAQPLARVLDPAALDEARGPRASVAVTIPPAWCGGGAAVAVRLPSVARCTRCDGGGCDGCDRQGALRLSWDEGEQAWVRAPVPPSLEGNVRMRLLRPFSRVIPACASERVGDQRDAGTLELMAGSTPVEQLFVEFRGASDPSENVRLLSRHRDPARGDAAAVLKRDGGTNLARLRHERRRRQTAIVIALGMAIAIAILSAALGDAL